VRWILIDVAVVLVALGVLAVVVRVLLRAVKALGRTVGAAGLLVTEALAPTGRSPLTQPSSPGQTSRGGGA
jgi:hypothetical protein